MFFQKNISAWFVKAILQRYWRLRRPATLGAQGIILNAQNEILLIRHTYRPGWHFPGGGVEFNETCEQALNREVLEETGVIIEQTPQLHGIFANFSSFPGDHIAVYIIQHWHQLNIPKPNVEIAEQDFFAYDNLPVGISYGTRARLAEIFDKVPRSSVWC